MVDVSGKAASVRAALAEGWLLIKPEHQASLTSLPKGDALTVAQVAGIQAAKKCSELIPLCHQVALTSVDVQIEPRDGHIRITAEACAKDATGVEMEAYTAVVVAGITLIDMLKGIDPDLTLTDVRLLKKTGGKRDWTR